MKEVYDNIFMITLPRAFFGLRDFVNIYIIAGKNGLVIDSGYPDKKSLRIFNAAYTQTAALCAERNIPFNIDRLLLTHAHQDHFAGMKKLRSQYGFKLMATKKMARNFASSGSYRNSYTMKNTPGREASSFTRATRLLKASFETFIFLRLFSIEFVPDTDIIIPDNTDIEINGHIWTIFHSPGHCDDHISLYNEQQGILFCGDNVLKSITTWLGPPRSCLDEYVLTLERYKKLPNLKLILPAHGEIITNPVERIDELIDWRKKRRQEILSIISRRGSVAKHEIVKHFYPARSFKRYLGAGWIELTLLDMEEKGLITGEMRKNKRIYRIS